MKWISGGQFQARTREDWMRKEEKRGREGEKVARVGLTNVWNESTPMVTVTHNQLAKFTQSCLLKTQFWLELAHVFLQFCLACSKCRLLLRNLLHCSQFCSFRLLHIGTEALTSPHSHLNQHSITINEHRPSLVPMAALYMLSRVMHQLLLLRFYHSTSNIV